MAPYVRIPQTPSAKTQLEENLQELASLSGQTTPAQTPARPLSPLFATTATAAAVGNASSKHPSLRPPETRFHRNSSIGSAPGDHGHYSPASFRSFSPTPDADGPHYAQQLLPPPLPPLSREQQLSSSSPPHPAIPSLIHRFWRRNRAVLYVISAQLFGALMNLSARLLELEGEQGLHPVQMLFVRMVITVFVCCAFMYWNKVPHFPLGPPAVRWLLVIRGFMGFFGIFGMWYSMMYLPLAEATVFTFLAPSVSGYICHVFLHEPFTRKEQVASLFALLGVVLIARPTSLFSALSHEKAAAAMAQQTANATAVAEAASDSAAAAAAVTGLDGAIAEAMANITSVIPTAAASRAGHPHLGDTISATERLIAIGVALLGVLGSASTFTTLRAIGTRAHPLISVNYFSSWCVFVTTIILVAAPRLDIGQPDLRFTLPHELRQWLLLVVICICGFLTQFLATKGLSLERSNRATAMVYTHMLFAATFDRVVFGHHMDIISLLGCGLIIGSALWAALSKKPATEKDARPNAAADIEIGFLNNASRAPNLPAGNVNTLRPQAEPESMPMLAATGGNEESDDEDMREEEHLEASRIS